MEHSVLNTLTDIHRQSQLDRSPQSLALISPARATESGIFSLKASSQDY